ncbi:Protein of unknown function DUF1645, plant [Dillenia turbinata]|uniref:Uncharacterized protein n=1 Tax=Dillenia turbinata TaxID=194707 RepID=A0AAN8V8G2_9MAGN
MDSLAFRLEKDASFRSAPASPSRFTRNTMYFYSMPSSPRRDDEFEFETSRKFAADGLFDHESVKNPQLVMKQQMAFADELFFNGLVLPMKSPQLKLPPRLQNGGGAGSNGLDYQFHSPAPSSPRSPSSLLKISFPRKHLWNDDFDPFLTALESVKEEQKDRNTKENHFRRAWSLFPLANASPSAGSKNDQGEKMGIENHTHPNEKTVPTESKDPKLSTFLESPEKIGRTRKQRMKEFLHRSASTGRDTSEEGKLKHQTWPLLKSKYWKSISFLKCREAASRKEKKNIPTEVDTLALYPPKMVISCLGFSMMRRR